MTAQSLLLDGDLMDDFEELKKAAIAKVLELAHKQPVIAFGFNELLHEFDFGSVNHVLCEDDSDVISARRLAKDTEKQFIMFLANGYKTGTDCKFKSEAAVVVLTDQMEMDGEEVL
jgi:hypothetical protein